MDAAATLADAVTTHASGLFLFFSSAAADAATAQVSSETTDADAMTDAAAQEADVTIHAYGLSLSFSSAAADADANIAYPD